MSTEREMDVRVDDDNLVAVAREFGNLKKIKANVVFKEDKAFLFQVNPGTGHKLVKAHEQDIMSVGSKNIKGAYAIYELADGSVDCEIMSINQITESWAQSSDGGNSDVYEKFPDQMALVTVINRACKVILKNNGYKTVYNGNKTLPETMKQKANQQVLNIPEAALVEETPSFITN